MIRTNNDHFEFLPVKQQKYNIDSDIYRGKNCHTGSAVAIKVIKKKLPINFLKINCENFVKIIAIDEFTKSNKSKKTKNVIIMEECTGPILFDSLNQPGPYQNGLPDDHFIRLLSCVYNCLNTLDKNGLNHGQFTAEHIINHTSLLSGNQLFKLIGFNVNRETDCELPYAWIQSVPWFSPQSLIVDLQMAGVTLFYAATGRFPMFSEMQTNKIDFEIKNDYRSTNNCEFPLDCNLSKSLRIYVEAMLKPLLSINKKPSLHEFFKNAEKILNSYQLQIFSVQQNQIENIYFFNKSWNGLCESLSHIYTHDDFENSLFFHHGHLLDHHTEPLDLQIHIQSALTNSTITVQPIPILTWVISSSQDCFEQPAEPLPLPSTFPDYSTAIRQYVTLAQFDNHIDLIEELIIAMALELREKSKVITTKKNTFIACVHAVISVSSNNSNNELYKMLNEAYELTKQDLDFHLQSPNGFVEMWISLIQKMQMSRGNSRSKRVIHLMNSFFHKLDESVNEPWIQKYCEKLVEEMRNVTISILKDHHIVKKCLSSWLQNVTQIEKKINLFDQLLEEKMEMMKAKSSRKEEEKYCSAVELRLLMEATKSFNQEIEYLQSLLIDAL